MLNNVIIIIADDGTAGNIPNPIAMKQTIRSLPKARLLTACLLLFSLFFIHQSCTKINTDVSGKLVLTDAEVAQKFFNMPANAPVAIRRAVDEMKKRNSQSKEFVKAFVKKNGYPIWDKATVAAGTSITTKINSSSATQEGDTLVVVPVLQDSSNVVKSFINITLNGEVSLAFYRGSDYSAYSYDDVPEDSINADKAAIQIMWLNYKVFGATKFIVNDDKLFMDGAAVYTGPHPRIVKIDPPTIPVLQGRFLMVQICNQIPTIQGCSCWHHDITQCTCTIPNCCWRQSCWYIYFPPYDDSPGGGSGGGSGDPTGGGGSTPGVDFPCASSQGRTIAIADPCGGGGSNPPPIYPVPPVPDCDPYIVLLQQDNFFAENLRYLQLDDVLFNLGAETGFAVNRSINQYWQPPSYAGSHTVSFANFLLPGVQVEGLLHSHPDGGNSIFSPADIVTMCRMFLKGQAKDTNNFFIGVTSTYDSAFLIKVNNVAAFRAFATKLVGENGDDGASISRFKRNYNYKLSSLDAEDNEREFLKMIAAESDSQFGEPPVALYKASFNCTHWSRLSLNNSNIIPKDCF